MNILVRNLFIRVIRNRVEREDRTAADIITEYPKLTDEEKQEILEHI